MKIRVLISPNSFKECADSVTIAGIINNNLSRLNRVETIVKPITDGGDGFLNVCRFYFGGEIRTYLISKPFDESIFACPVLYCEERREVYIESAEVLGLKKVPAIFRNPLKLSSKGLGELLIKLAEDVRQQKIQVNKVFIGIGGTSTIDMGMGMMSKLGLSFYDSLGEKLAMLPENFKTVEKFKYEPICSSFEVIPVLDVVNPLFGDDSGIRIYGGQKSANENNILYLEKSFNHLVNLFINNNLQISSNKLSGAGGGIPAAFQIFFKSKILLSNEFIFDNLGLSKETKLEYVVTGEGAYDFQSGFGKGAGLVISRFHSKVNNVFLICGKLRKDSIVSLPKNVIPFSISDYFESEKESILNFKNGIDKACQEVIKLIDF